MTIGQQSEDCLILGYVKVVTKVLPDYRHQAVGVAEGPMETEDGVRKLGAQVGSEESLAEIDLLGGDGVQEEYSEDHGQEGEDLSDLLEKNIAALKSLSILDIKDDAQQLFLIKVHNTLIEVGGFADQLELAHAYFKYYKEDINESYEAAFGFNVLFPDVVQGTEITMFRDEDNGELIFTIKDPKERTKCSNESYFAEEEAEKFAMESEAPLPEFNTEKRSVSGVESPGKKGTDSEESEEDYEGDQKYGSWTRSELDQVEAYEDDYVLPCDEQPHHRYRRYFEEEIRETLELLPSAIRWISWPVLHAAHKEIYERGLDILEPACEFYDDVCMRTYCSVSMEVLIGAKKEDRLFCLRSRLDEVIDPVEPESPMKFPLVSRENSPSPMELNKDDEFLFKEPLFVKHHGLQKIEKAAILLKSLGVAKSISPVPMQFEERNVISPMTSPAGAKILPPEPKRLPMEVTSPSEYETADKYISRLSMEDEEKEEVAPSLPRSPSPDEVLSGPVRSSSSLSWIGEPPLIIDENTFGVDTAREPTEGSCSPKTSWHDALADEEPQGLPSGSNCFSPDQMDVEEDVSPSRSPPAANQHFTPIPINVEAKKVDSSPLESATAATSLLASFPSKSPSPVKQSSVLMENDEKNEAVTAPPPRSPLPGEVLHGPARPSSSLSLIGDPPLMIDENTFGVDTAGEPTEDSCSPTTLWQDALEDEEAQQSPSGSNCFSQNRVEEAVSPLRSPSAAQPFHPVNIDVEAKEAVASPLEAATAATSLLASSPSQTPTGAKIAPPIYTKFEDKEEVAPSLFKSQSPIMALSSIPMDRHVVRTPLPSKESPVSNDLQKEAASSRSATADTYISPVSMDIEEKEEVALPPSMSPTAKNLQEKTSPLKLATSARSLFPPGMFAEQEKAAALSKTPIEASFFFPARKEETASKPPGESKFDLIVPMEVEEKEEVAVSPVKSASPHTNLAESLTTSPPGVKFPSPMDVHEDAAPAAKSPSPEEVIYGPVRPSSSLSSIGDPPLIVDENTVGVDSTKEPSEGSCSPAPSWHSSAHTDITQDSSPRSYRSISSLREEHKICGRREGRRTIRRNRRSPSYDGSRRGYMGSRSRSRSRTRRRHDPSSPRRYQSPGRYRRSRSRHRRGVASPASTSGLTLWGPKFVQLHRDGRSPSPVLKRDHRQRLSSSSSDSPMKRLRLTSPHQRNGRSPYRSAKSRRPNSRSPGRPRTRMPARPSTRSPASPGRVRTRIPECRSSDRRSPARTRMPDRRTPERVRTRIPDKSTDRVRTRVPERRSPERVRTRIPDRSRTRIPERRNSRSPARTRMPERTSPERRRSPPYSKSILKERLAKLMYEKDLEAFAPPSPDHAKKRKERFAKDDEEEALGSWLPKAVAVPRAPLPKISIAISGALSKTAAGGSMASAEVVEPIPQVSHPTTTEILPAPVPAKDRKPAKTRETKAARTRMPERTSPERRRSPPYSTSILKERLAKLMYEKDLEAFAPPSPDHAKKRKERFAEDDEEEALGSWLPKAVAVPKAPLKISIAISGALSQKASGGNVASAEIVEPIPQVPNPTTTEILPVPAPAKDRKPAKTRETKVARTRETKTAKTRETKAATREPNSSIGQRFTAKLKRMF